VPCLRLFVGTRARPGRNTMSQTVFTHCLRCNRPLSNEKSRDCGYGQVCRAKMNYKPTRIAEDMKLETIKEPMEFDIHIKRHGDPFDIGNLETNVPWSVIQHSPTGFEIGYGGSGPADLALNILNAFVPPGKDGLAAVPCYKGECSQTAWRLHQTFKFEYIATMKKGGGTIKKEVISGFIKAREHEFIKERQEA